MTELQQLRNSRRKQTAECFTPPELVNEMLDKLPSDIWDDPSKTFIDPAGGSGNFVIEILKRKLKNNHPPLQALSTIFSIELMPDNVEEMKQRLLDLLPPLSDDDLLKAKDIINHNIVCHDALTWDYENWCSTKHKSKSLF
jgi:hypothetical protein